MRPLEMIAEWRRGCTNAGPRAAPYVDDDDRKSPAACVECTEGLIDALEPALIYQERRLEIWRSLAIISSGCALIQGALFLIGKIA